MAKSIELTLKDGETLESGVRRIMRKVQTRTARKKSALLDHAIEEVKTLSPERQAVIAEVILAELRQPDDPNTRRFHELVEAKYTKGLTVAESSEMDQLERAFRDSDEAFYRPSIEMARAQKSVRAEGARKRLK